MFTHTHTHTHTLYIWFVYIIPPLYCPCFKETNEKENNNNKPTNKKQRSSGTKKGLLLLIVIVVVYLTIHQASCPQPGPIWSMTVHERFLGVYPSKIVNSRLNFKVNEKKIALKVFIARNTNVSYSNV